jgi:hypothetical protein
VKLAEMELRRPRAFGNCWLGCELWRLGLAKFWRERLAAATPRETVPWEKVLALRDTIRYWHGEGVEGARRGATIPRAVTG